MKVYHTLKFGTYNAACFFVHQRLPITKVDNLGGNLFRYWVGDELVATWDEMTGEMLVYRYINTFGRYYGKLW